MRPIHLKHIQEEKAKEAAKNAELAARPDAAQTGTALQAALRESVLREMELREDAIAYGGNMIRLFGKRGRRGHRPPALVFSPSQTRVMEALNAIRDSTLNLKSALESSTWCEQLAEQRGETGTAPCGNLPSG